MNTDLAHTALALSAKLRDTKPIKERFYQGQFRPSSTCRAAAVYERRYSHVLTDYITGKNLARLAQRKAKRG